MREMGMVGRKDWGGVGSTMCPRGKADTRLVDGRRSPYTYVKRSEQELGEERSAAAQRPYFDQVLDYSREVLTKDSGEVCVAAC